MNIVRISDWRRKTNSKPDRLWLAAEAVVDAAISCKMHCAVEYFPQDVRRRLIEAVYLDPTVTGQLFGDRSGGGR